MKSLELFKEGKLDEALETAFESVRNAPSNVAARSALCELLCFAGDLERADKQLDAIAQVDPEAMVGVSMFRHLIRAEQARLDFFHEGRVPEFVVEPSEELRLRLSAHIAIREGRSEDAQRALQEADSKRCAVSGTCDGTEFDDIRDPDDLLGSVFEVLTSNGKYYWIPFDLITAVSFDPVEHTRDLLWRPMEISVEGELEGRVYAPALYYGTSAAEDQKTRVGQATDWTEEVPGIVRGIGQRMLLVGDDVQPVLQISELTLSKA